MNSLLFKYNPLYKKDILNIYYAWININKSLYIKYYNLIGLIVMALLIPVDFILYKDNIFSSYRVIYISIILLNLLFVQVNQKTLFKLGKDYSIQYHLLLPGLLYNLLYIYYMCLVIFKYPSYLDMVLLANFITIIATTMFAMKFWKEQYIINFVSVFTILVFYAFNINNQEVYTRFHYGIYIISIHLISFVFAFIYRRNFILSMYEKYCTTASMVPRNVAKHIAATDSNVKLDEIFKPTKRFTVCLSSDWRDFQKLTKDKDPEIIEKLFQNFYNIVFEELDRIFPNGNYYADWTADEIFIIFFDESDNENYLLVEKALEFAKTFSLDVFERVNNLFEIELLYDIGMSCGEGLLGLQGPEKLKKTTITGESAGTAKRLETEAKNFRIDNHTNKYPILFIDSNLYEFTNSVKLQQFEYKEMIATTKNIKNKKIYQCINI